MVAPRAGASGPFVLQETARRLAWDGQANLRLTALAAGHPAGDYSVIVTFTVLAAPGVGIVARAVEWSDGGVAQLFNDPNTASFGTTGPQFNSPIVIHSDGTAALVAELQPGGVPLGAVADVSVSALQQSRG